MGKRRPREEASPLSWRQTCVCGPGFLVPRSPLGSPRLSLFHPVRSGWAGVAGGMGGEKGIKGKQPKTGWGGHLRRGAEPSASPQAPGEAAGESVDPREVTAGQGFPSLMFQAEGVPPSSLWGLPAWDSSWGACGHSASAAGATGILYLLGSASVVAADTRGPQEGGSGEQRLAF